MPQKESNHEQMPARFPLGTLDRMEAVLDKNENRAELIRLAVERELARRERRLAPGGSRA